MKKNPDPGALKKLHLKLLYIDRFKTPKEEAGAEPTNMVIKGGAGRREGRLQSCDSFQSLVSGPRTIPTKSLRHHHCLHYTTA